MSRDYFFMETQVRIFHLMPGFFAGNTDVPALRLADVQTLQSAPRYLSLSSGF